MSSKFEKQAKALIKILWACLAVVCLAALYLNLTHEYVTRPGTKAVIVDAGLLDTLLHWDGVIQPGTSRVSKSASTVSVIDGHEYAGIGPLMKVMAKDAVPVRLDFTFDFKVNDPKLLVTRFGRDWKLDALWGAINACILELASEHDSAYFNDGTDPRVVGKALEDKVQASLAQLGMPISVENFNFGAGRGVYRSVSPGRGIYGKRSSFGPIKQEGFVPH